MQKLRRKPDCDLVFRPTLLTLTFATPPDGIQACTTSYKQPCPAVLWSKCPNQAGWFRETLTQEKLPGSHTSSSTTTVVRDKVLCTPRCLLSILMTFSSSRSGLQQCTSPYAGYSFPASLSTTLLCVLFFLDGRNRCLFGRKPNSLRACTASPKRAPLCTSSPRCTHFPISYSADVHGYVDDPSFARGRPAACLPFGADPFGHETQVRNQQLAPFPSHELLRCVSVLHFLRRRLLGMQSYRWRIATPSAWGCVCMFACACTC